MNKRSIKYAKKKQSRIQKLYSEIDSIAGYIDAGLSIDAEDFEHKVNQIKAKRKTISEIWQMIKAKHAEKVTKF